MRLYNYLRQARENPNLWWTLDSGAHLDLFEQAIEKLTDTLEMQVDALVNTGFMYRDGPDVALWEALTGKPWDEDE